jgi:hypothetical protein
MQFVDIELPVAALIGQEALHLAKTTAALSGHWFDAKSRVGEGLPIWPPRVGTAPASPVKSNAGPERISNGLHLTAGRNCGYWVKSITNTAQNFAFALRFGTMADDLGTGLTLNPRSARGYHVLSHRADMAVFMSGRAQLALPLPRRSRDLFMVAGFSGARSFLRAGGQMVISEPDPDPTLGGPADLFIGCRGHADRQSHTLGDGVIASALFWPVNILDPEQPAGASGLAALEAYDFWGG